jgi:hypothetical protein
MNEFTPLYADSHSITEGSITVDIEFMGNTLFVEVDFNTILDRSNIQLGILYIYSGNVSKGYRIDFKQSIISLPVYNVSKIRFIPTLDLFALYTLDLKYATVGSVIDSPNAYPLSEQITGLPNRVTLLEGNWGTQNTRLSSLESALNSLSNPDWNDIADKPTTFTPSNHNHSISDITGLSNQLQTIESSIVDLDGIASRIDTRVTSLESVTGNSSNSGSTTYNLLVNNSFLEVNKAYFIAGNNLELSLPPNPTLANYIDLSIHNFSAKVFHGTTSQSILNNSSLSISGTQSGIILKPYSSCRLMFLGNNLWMLQHKDRAVNNWLAPSLMANQRLNYTASLIGASAQYGSTVSGLYNGVKIQSGNLADGMITDTSNPANIRLQLNFSIPVALTSFKIWNGQGNSAGASRSPQSFKLLRSDFSEIEAFSCAGRLAEYTEFNYSLSNPDSSDTATQWFLEFLNNQSSLIALMELEVYGFAVSGGEVVVT